MKVRLEAAKRMVWLAAMVFAAGCSGCTTYRIVRFRQPDARNQTMFPDRAVRTGGAASPFARLATLRSDLDTVTVRAFNGTRVPFSQYVRDYAVLAFVVIRNDTIVYETYRDGMTDSTTHNSFSMAKSVLSALVGIAVGEGKLRLDEPVETYLPWLRGKPAFAGVTVRHLLGMRSGLRYTETGDGFIKDFLSDEARMYYATNRRKRIAGTPRVAEPGSVWDYKDTDAELLGIVLSSAVGKTVAAYTEEKLWSRIGTEHNAKWSLDHKNGDEQVASGFFATARDFARFGRLYLNGGVHNGEQIVPADWVRNSVAVDTTRPEPEISTWWKMQHTMYWWHPIQPPAGEFFADGSNGERLYVDPKTRTIIVQLANDSRQDFPFRKITAYLNGGAWEYPRLIPGLLRQAGTAFGPDSIRPMYARFERERLAAPERYALTRSGMLSAGTLLADDSKTRAAGLELLRLDTELYPQFADAFVRLSDACTLAGDAAGAVQAINRAFELAPNNAVVIERRKKLGVR